MKSLKQRNKFKGNRRINRRSKASFTSTNMQTMGPGVAIACCNGLLSINDSGIDETYATSLSVAGLGGAEFAMYTSMYKYFKINKIVITFLPINYIDETGGMFFQVQWRLAASAEKYGVPLDDNSKYIGINFTTPKSFVFRPPNVTFTNFQYTAFNFREWIPTYVGYLNLPISIVYTRIGYNSFQYLANVQFYLTFRGANVIDIDSAKIKLDTSLLTMKDRRLLLKGNSRKDKDKIEKEDNKINNEIENKIENNIDIITKAQAEGNLFSDQEERHSIKTFVESHEGSRTVKSQIQQDDQETKDEDEDNME